MSDEPQARRFFVSGDVQGVGFRFFTQNAANRAGICGYVRNLRDGRVEVYATGTEKQMRELPAAIHRGPIGASVNEVIEEVASVEPQYAAQFRVTYDH